MKADKILKAVNGATKDWTKRKKAEIRNSRPSNFYYYSDRVNFTDVAAGILPKAYNLASGNGQYTVATRQLYYSSRQDFLDATGREMKWDYFAGTFLIKFMNRNPSLVKGWKVTSDPRGEFFIPHTRKPLRIPVGTIDIDDYLDRAFSVNSSIENIELDYRWPSVGPRQRFQAVIYIEKEGFNPMLHEARIAERFDVAIISCKGQSVVAARKLVDHVCHSEGVPVFVIHDFDKYGFEIRNCLTEVSWAAKWDDRVRYEFENEIEAVDLGLRLADVEEYDLRPEDCKPFKGSLPAGLTDDEREFLDGNQRVELNAFTAPQFIEWIETKLGEHLPERLIPEDDIIEQAYRRAVGVADVNRELAKLLKQAAEKIPTVDVPDDLREQLDDLIDDHTPWDKAIYELAKDFDAGE